MNTPGESGHRSQARFAETRWTLVLSAQNDEAPEADRALETLCRNYWHPLYAFARRQGRSPHDAQDLTQGFFLRLLEKKALRRADPERGRFRNFLLVAFKRYMANEYERASAQKRGGGQPLFSVDLQDAEGHYAAEPVDNLSAERLYERRWACALLEATMLALQTEYAAKGQGRDFDVFKALLAEAKKDEGYEELGAKLGLSAGAARVAAHRLRRRFRELLRQEIAHTVASASEVDDELRHLLSVLGGNA